MRKSSFLIILVAFSACRNFLTDPQKIIDKSIEAAGGDTYLNSIIEFDFENKHYITKRHGDVFSNECISKDSIGTIRDLVSNKGYIREINGMIEVLPDSLSVAYAASTNSVISFALFPFGLNNPSVRKKYLGDTMIENQIFYKVEITFAQDSSDKDSQRVFQYWINRHNFTIGYIAYSSHESGLHLQKSFNPRKVNDIQFYDYIIYTPKDNSAKMEDLELLFTKGELAEVSKAELQNIRVE